MAPCVNTVPGPSTFDAPWRMLEWAPVGPVTNVAANLAECGRGFVPGVEWLGLYPLPSGVDGEPFSAGLDGSLWRGEGELASSFGVQNFDI